jgi:excinuclease ABC subunit C
LWYQLGRCPAPCTIKIKNQKSKIKNECQRNVRNLIKILQGKKTQVLRDLKKEMRKLSKAQEFERAAKVRDQIEALERVLQHSQIFQLFPEKELESWPEIEKKLKKILGIRKKIKRIEAYDISNIQGQRATGSMVVFEKGVPNKNDYRKFKIKIAGKPNDIAMLKEVLNRRFKHPEWKFPQVILIDGGKAQLNAAISGIRDSRIRNKELGIKVLALAKRKNELYIEDKKKPILLKDLPREVSNLILQIRDEAHRFAISYHRKLRTIDFQPKS